MTTAKKTRHASAAHSAPDRPPPASAAPSADPSGGGATAAVWAALAANPGATAAQIAAAAGTSRAIAGRELAALQAAGRATRVDAGRGAPATWEPSGQTELSPPGADVESHGDQPPSEPASPAPADVRSADAEDTTEASTASRQTEPAADSGNGGPAGPDAGSETAEAGTTEPDGDARGPSGASGQGEEPVAADGAASPPGHAGSPAAHNEALDLLAELAETAKSAAAALRGGDVAAALAAAETACDRAARARRMLKPTGRKARGGAAARPGQLRDLVRGHLAAYPDAEFTPHAIGRVLGRSSGAVANALDKLTALGQAELTSEHPRKYKATAGEAVHSYLAA